MYDPQPIDTSKAELPERLVKLREILAKNTHDIWARQRIAEGWTYGPERDDTRKQNPCLVPYEQLPESEKEYDRKTAMETLKMIVALDYRIVPPLQHTISSSGSSGEEVAGVLKQLRDPTPLDLATLLKIWERRSTERWAGSPEIYEQLGKRVLSVGEPLIAYDILTKGLEYWPKRVRLRQLLALALVRSGATERANRILTQLHKDEEHTDGETLGLLARTHKDLWTMAMKTTEQKAQLRLAHGYYGEGYRFALKESRVDDAYYTGINAATTGLLLGKKEVAHNLAKEIHNLCMLELERLNANESDTYWVLATLGEAALILEEYSKAEDWYCKAAEKSQGRFADLSGTRRQARLLLEFLGADRHRFDHCFRVPRIVVFASHMIHQSGQPYCFSASVERKIRQEIATRLERLDAGFGYGSAASGLDILFLKAMLERRGEVHVVLPFSKDEFQKAVVGTIPGANWGKRLQSVLERATRVIVASEHRTTGSTVDYKYSSLVQDGLAILKAQMLDTELIPLVVCGRGFGGGLYGIRRLIRYWRSQGREPEVVDIAALTDVAVIQSSSTDKPMIPATAHQTSTLPGFSQKIMAMLFADVVGYSKLKEEEIPRFVDHFLGAVADLLHKSPNAPVMKNTWGDALYFVFKNVEDAGRFALDLRDRLCGTNWEKKGLPKDLSLRIALHAGPVYSCKEPVIQKHNYTGSHVSRAARIEPITPPGQVYASQPFAALAAAQRITEFTCDYVGEIPLAKKYGTFQTYHVRRISSR